MPDLYDHGPCRVCGEPIQRNIPPRAYSDLCDGCDIPSYKMDDDPMVRFLYRGHMDPDTGTLADFPS